MFPKWEMRLHGGPSMTKYSDIESYDKIVTISEFSRIWIKEYWKMESLILFPPVNIQAFLPAPVKRNMIAHVGRFFVGGHSKKQLELVRVFKQLCDSGVKDWELHLIGSVSPGEVHLHYLETIKEEIEHYPVIIHLDIPFNELKHILSESKLYWHATGLDETDPIKMEHFGITTVEAMASGCVPLVINKGGQPQIVTKKSGYIWETRGELLKLSKELINNPDLLKEMSAGALLRSKDFSKEQFRMQLKKLLPYD
jgi:glycosyltransferase involved in cell wall biosynthesis